MQKIHTRISISLAIMMLAAASAACGSAPSNLEADDTAAPSGTAGLQESASTPIPTLVPTTLPPLAPITPANADRIREIGAIPPNQPPSFHLSTDGSTLAVGDAGGIRVLDASTGTLLAEIPLSVPDCAFGMGRTFRLNADGRFITAATVSSIEVWQVGGGRIYKAPYNRRYATDPDRCGADLPQLALSPDGMRLAISMVALERTSAKKVFRVVDIPTNTILTEWVVKGDGPQGVLYGYPALGFSHDGSLLMTFDPMRFRLHDGKPLLPFRFWAVDTWEELEPDSFAIASAFNSGELLFSLSGDGTLQVLSRTDGSQTAMLAGVPCRTDNPCPTIFSPDGKYLALLDFSTGTQAYQRQVFATRLQVWDIEQQKKIADVEGLWRDLEGWALSNSGELLPIPAEGLASALSQGWWTYPEFFDGFQPVSPERMAFVPTSIHQFYDGECTACGTCILDLAAMDVACTPGFLDMDSQAGRLSVGYDSGSPVLVRDEEGGQAEIIGSLPTVDQGIVVRLLSYDGAFRTVFYCLEKDGRQQDCLIVDLDSEEVLASMNDIHQLRLSPDGQYAAFVDRSINAAFLMELAGGKLTRMKPYQARALPVGVAFSPDGSAMVYLVQSTTAASRYYLEWVETVSGKVMQRFDLRKLDMAQPVALGADPSGAFWALADAGGQILLLDTENAALLHAWHAHDIAVLSLAFSQDGKYLVSMDRRGWMRVWGIQ